jgi:hypothetical protein
MRFVVGYYLTQNALNNPKERTASSPRKAVRRPGTGWLAALRLQRAAAPRSPRAQTSEALRSGS